MTIETLTVDNLTEVIKPKPITNLSPNLKPSVLYKFLIDKGISCRNIGDLMGIAPSNVWAYLNGKKPMPKNRQKEIETIVQTVIKWEMINGRKFIDSGKEN